MREKMMAMFREMIEHGYCLVGETLDEFTDRMISYGFDDSVAAKWRDDWMVAYGGACDAVD